MPIANQIENLFLALLGKYIKVLLCIRLLLAPIFHSRSLPVELSAIYSVDHFMCLHQQFNYLTQLGKIISG